ncbi:MAG: sialidase family protein [Planctomycetota bacterium]|jgi:hypothetical protein
MYSNQNRSFKSVALVFGLLVFFCSNVLGLYCGSSWVDYSTPPAQLYSIDYDGSLYVATGAFKIMSSPDGQTWTARKNLPSVAGNGVVYSSEKNLWVVVGAGGLIETSSNGTTWTTRTSGTTKTLLDVTYGNGTFIAVGYTGTVRKSTDGINWSAGGAMGGGNVGNVAFNSSTGRFVGINLAGQVYTSDNTGSSWTFRQTISDSQAIGYGNGVWLAGGKDSGVTKMWKSTNDGASWTQLTVPSNTNYMYDIIYTGSNYVAVGYGGLVFTSTNGTSWTDDSDSGNFRDLV